MFLGLNASASALSAENVRLNVVADNIANVDTTSTPQGGPYRRQFVVLEALPDAANGVGQGVEVQSIQTDPSPLKAVYDPTAPQANAFGEVFYPNVHLATEMVDLIAASQAYSANVNAYNADKSLALKALTIGG